MDSKANANASHLAYLNAMGITAWVRREASPGESATAFVTTEASPKIVSGAESTTSAQQEVSLHSTSLSQLAEQVRVCHNCGLHSGRTQSVFGVGNPQATWMIVGEAPGAEEDRQGEPFVGRAGKLLNNMLLALGLKREQVYIANIIKCRPPNNRDPQPEEVRQCLPYLERQIALIQPAIIIAVGRVAAQNLLQKDDTLGRLRGQRFSYGSNQIPVVVTYHPAYLLRSPREKAKAWQDLCLARRLLAAEGD